MNVISIYLSVNYRINKELYILDRNIFCLNDKEIFNVIVFVNGNFELYYGIFLFIFFLSFKYFNI